MTNQPGVWGIDLGQCALKAIRLENIEGQVTATAFDYVEHPKILSQPDADPDQLTREALEKFLARNPLQGDIVAISIPGQSGLARFVKLPPVEEKKITEIVRFEAKQQIPFNLDEVVWDYQKIGSGVVTDGFAMETEIGLFAIKRDTVNRYLQHFKDVNVEVHVVQMAPLALCNFVAYDLLGEGSEGCIVALDIGADNSNLVITDGGKIIWQRPIPLGGNHFTRALTKDLKLTFAKAEHLKRNATKSPDLKKILAALKPVLNDFVGEVQRSLGYFTNTHRDAQIQYMIGLGNAFRLPGLQKFLSEKLQLDVRKLQKLERTTGDSVVSAPVFTENVLSFAVPYGLALQGLGLTKLQTNLLPQDIRFDRMIRAKKPWAVAAAAALLLGTSVSAFGYAMQYRAVNTADGTVVGNALKRGGDVVKENNDWNSKCSAEEAKIGEAKKAVKSIIAGQEERVNWVLLNQFIAEALPQPDASNLSPQAKVEFFTSSEAAQKAAAAYYARHAGKSKGGDEEEILSDLISVNVEAVTCRFSNDLSNYNAKLKALGAQMDSMPAKWRTTPPESGKPGWVIELRGYTYHKQNRRFLISTLVDNLGRLRVKDDPAAIATPATPTTPAPGTTPPTTAAAPTTPSTEPAAEGDKKEDPVWNRVSHPVLVWYHPEPNPESNAFRLIGSTVVNEFANASTANAGGDGGAMAGPPGVGMPTMSGGNGMQQGGPSGSGGSRDNWSPLGGGSGGGTGGPTGTGGGGFKGGGGGMGGPPGLAGPPMGSGGGMPSVPRMGGGGFKGGGGGMGGPPGLAGGPQMGGNRYQGGSTPPADIPPDSSTDKKKIYLTRTEFIVLFIWREPTPSDELLSPIEDTGGGSNYSSGPPPGYPGSGGGRPSSDR